MMATVGCDDDDKATNETGCFPERGQVHREKAVEELKSKTGVDFHKFWGLAQFSLAAVVWGGMGMGQSTNWGLVSSVEGCLVLGLIWPASAQLYSGGN